MARQTPQLVNMSYDTETDDEPDYRTESEVDEGDYPGYSMQDGQRDAAARTIWQQYSNYRPLSRKRRQTAYEAASVLRDMRRPEYPSLQAAKEAAMLDRVTKKVRTVFCRNLRLV